MATLPHKSWEISFRTACCPPLTDPGWQLPHWVQGKMLELFLETCPSSFSRRVTAPMNTTHFCFRTTGVDPNGHKQPSQEAEA